MEMEADVVFLRRAPVVIGPSFRRGDRYYFVSGQPLSLAVKNALSPGTTASSL
jgi:hypothetical protein